MQNMRHTRPVVTAALTLTSLALATCPARARFTDSLVIDSNMDGLYPSGGVTFVNGTLYGTTLSGGSSGAGTVFSVRPDGTGFQTLHTFATTIDGPLPPSPFLLTFMKTDGVNPFGGVTFVNGALYGTTSYGGSSCAGTVFSVRPDGTGFQALHAFSATSDSRPNGNADGAAPSGGLTLANGTLYGTTHSGGSSGAGTVFSVRPDGTGFQTLHAFKKEPTKR